MVDWNTILNKMWEPYSNVDILLVNELGNKKYEYTLNKVVWSSFWSSKIQQIVKTTTSNCLDSTYTSSYTMIRNLPSKIVLSCQQMRFELAKEHLNIFNKIVWLEFRNDGNLIFKKSKSLTSTSKWTKKAN